MPIDYIMIILNWHITILDNSKLGSTQQWMTLTCCQDHILTENIWFVWSETSYSGDERRCHRCRTTNEQTNTEDRATQPMEAGGWVSQLGRNDSQWLCKQCNLVSFPVLRQSFCGKFKIVCGFRNSRNPPFWMYKCLSSQAQRKGGGWSSKEQAVTIMGQPCSTHPRICSW